MIITAARRRSGPFAFQGRGRLEKIVKIFSSGLVFPGKSGKQVADFKGPWLRIRKMAGLPVTFRLHFVRHHFGSTLVSNGVVTGRGRQAALPQIIFL